MKFRIKTRVSQAREIVFEGFGVDLFKALEPPFSKITLHRFDGSKLGDRIELEILLWGILRQSWKNEITEYEKTEKHFFFVDEGIEVPFPLKKWRHKHLVTQELNGTKGEKSGIESGCFITDEISYSTGTLIIDWLAFPIIWLQFYMRKPIYRKFFGRK